MKNYTRGVDGTYIIHGNKYSQLIGSRAQVWHGSAYKTVGGLHKSNLLKSHGRIVSKLKHNTAKKENRLVKAGYGTRKGHFGAISLKRKGSKSRKLKGGTMNRYHLSEAAGIDDGPLDEALMAGGTYNPTLLPSDANNGSPLDRALLAGGKRRKHKSRK